MKTLLIIGAGGFLGSISRYLTQLSVTKHFPGIFPYGTLAVNIAGCLLIGMIWSLAERGNLVSQEWRIFLATGFCGGFTTFSAFSIETIGLMRTGQMSQAGMYVGASLLLGVLATYIGIALVRSF